MILPFVGLLIIFTGAFWFWQTYLKEEHELIQATGTIEATSVNLSAKLAGTIEVLSIEQGELVKKGDLVAELRRNDLIAQRERDELSVAKAQANLADLLSGAREQEIRAALAGINVVKTKLEQAEAELKRIEALFKEGALTEVEYEKAQTNVEIINNELMALEAQYELLTAGSRTEVIKAAQVEVERTQAILKATEAILEDLKVYAPLDGAVLTKNYELGEYVTPGAVLATIANLDDLWIKVYIPTDDLPKIFLGQKVTFTVSGSPKIFEGVVQEIATKGEFTPRTIQTKKERTNVVFAVKIGIKNGEGILKPGMPADVVFSGGDRDD
ncbi:MAG: HlyD family efflux transporter periplasmic adaptor subunit [Clostridia bacterium]|nr:HlyD family efflux transporter periplasmic adaptor subunit [Clostridia bacterium]